MHHFTKVLKLLICFAIIISCKKNPEKPDPAPPPPDPPANNDTTPYPLVRAFFSMNMDCSPNSFVDTIKYVDSTVVFSNNSDTGMHVTYKWFFGDNETSTEVNTSHVYKLPGKYNVALITYYKNKASDTASRTINILIGAHGYTTNVNYTRAIDCDVASEDGVLALLYSWDKPLDPITYSLLKTDSFLNPVFIKPVSGSSIRLSSLKKTNSNDYILSGNFSDGDTKQFSVSKIDESGNLLWVKYLSVAGENIYTSETSDGGFITIGNYNNTDGLYTVVVKLDANGNEIWKRPLNNTIKPFAQGATNIIETSSGFVFASLILTGSTQTLVLTNLDFNGSIISQKQMLLNSDLGYVAMVGLAKTGNTIIVYPKNSSGYIYLFDDNFSLLQINKIWDTGIVSIISYNNNFYACAGTWAQAYTFKIDQTGQTPWGVLYPNVTAEKSCSYSYVGNTRLARKIIKSDHDFITLADGWNDGSQSRTSAAYLLRVTQDGEIR